MQKTTKNVDDYIAKAPNWAKGTLRELRRVIRAAAPTADESISYHMPYYSHHGRLAYFGVHTNHCGFYWISKEDKKTFSKELARQKVVGSTLQIPRGQQVPATLIQKIIRSRVAANKASKKD